MPKIAVLVRLFPVTKIGISQQLYTLFASEGAEGIAFMKDIGNFFDTSSVSDYSFIVCTYMLFSFYLPGLRTSLLPNAYDRACTRSQLLWLSNVQYRLCLLWTSNLESKCKYQRESKHWVEGISCTSCRHIFHEQTLCGY